MSLGGHGKKIIICDDPRDCWGAEDGVSRVERGGVGRSLWVLVFEPPLFNCQFAESEMNFQRLFGKENKGGRERG